MNSDYHEEYTNESLYARNNRSEVIFIGDVLPKDKGLGPGYYCLGCHKTMQAVLPKTKVSKYFRHHVAKSNPENRCTYSQESHRHFLSKTYLKDLNKIKVPSLYKYPDSVDDPIYQIREADFVNAHSVVLEKAVFEDEHGEIQLISKDKIDKKYLFIIPDAILLNEKNEPILLVEFVATHKPDQEKLMKLKRLGIDAVQVNVPKSSPEEIKRNLLISKNTKWLFNNEEQNTPYVQISKEDPRRVYDVDELQRSLFEEGYKCRSAQLGDLIRSIKSILESESYRTIEQDIESEIRRITLASERAESELEELREKHSRSGIERHRVRRENFEKSREKFSLKAAELEGRYLSKRSRDGREITTIVRDISDIRGRTGEITENIRSIELQSNPEEAIRREREIKRALKSEVEKFGRQEDELQQSFDREFGTLSEREQQVKSDLQRKITSISDDYERELQESIRNFDSIKDGIEGRIVRTRESRDSIGEKLRRKEVELESETSKRIRRRREDNEAIRKDRIEKLNNGDFEGALLNQRIYERLPQLNELTKLYSKRLEIFRRIEKED